MLGRGNKCDDALSRISFRSLSAGQEDRLASRTRFRVREELLCGARGAQGEQDTISRAGEELLCRGTLAARCMVSLRSPSLEARPYEVSWRSFFCLFSKGSGRERSLALLSGEKGKGSEEYVTIGLNLRRRDEGAILIEQEHGALAYLQFEQLRSYGEVIHGIFTRQGGYSEGVYAGLNASALSGKDDYVTVARNREMVLEALGIVPQECVTLWQVHGVDVRVLDAGNKWRTDWGKRSYWEQAWTPETIHKGDALITRERGIALALSFADCTPIVFYDPIVQAIGIAHGGWRGTARGIVLATVEAMQQRFGSRAENILANIGPTIGACCYEVGEELQDLFCMRREFEERPVAEEYRKRVRESAVFSTKELPDRQSLRLDLQATHRNQLLMAGIRPEHIEVANICTSCNKERFFSHRGEQGKTGRFPVVIQLKRGSDLQPEIGIERT